MGESTGRERHTPDPVLELLLDPERLSGLLRAPVRATRVRPKPGVSHTAALHGPDGKVLGWVQALVGPARAKATKARGRAERYGLGALIGSLPLPLWDAELVWGGIATDPELASPLRRSGLDLAAPGLVLLRYNPLRRLVVRDGAHVVRVTAEPHAQRMSTVARDLAARGLPVVVPLEPGANGSAVEGTHEGAHGGPDEGARRVRVSRRVSVWPWVEGSDLTRADLAPVREAGELAARLHRATQAGTRSVAPDLPDRGWPDLLAAARHSVALLDAVAPEVAHPVRLALAGLPQEEPGPGPSANGDRSGHTVGDPLLPDDDRALLHGDLSLDQFLLGDDGVVRLTDLDRACLGPVELDLASVRAALVLQEVRGRHDGGEDSDGCGDSDDSDGGEGGEGGDDDGGPGRGIARGGSRAGSRSTRGHGAVAWESFLDGYGWSSLSGAWVCAALLARVAEPWRSQAPGWREQTREVGQVALDHLTGSWFPGPQWRVPAQVCGRAADDAADAAADGSPDGAPATVTVGRAWPAGVHDGRPRVAVEGLDERGRLRAGTLAAGGGVTLLPHGVDPRLPELAAEAGTGSLIVHRAGRRAVVHRPDGYLKVVRPGRARALVEASVRGAAVARAAGFAAADVLDRTDGVVLTATLHGIPVQRLASDASWSDIWDVWAAGWARWQRLPAAGLAAHTPAHEAQVLRTWADRVGALGLLAGTPWTERLERTAQELDRSPQLALTLAHRDLHDGQLLWDGERVGVVDLDTVCRAEPALDLANLAVHAGLREAQGLWSAGAAERVREAVDAVACDSGVPRPRLELARRATVARLAAVYCLRPRWRDVVLGWAEQQWTAEARRSV